jgi:peptidoglycan hydrolase-like protein with peptidoglycan-binding domain
MGQEAWMSNFTRSLRIIGVALAFGASTMVAMTADAQTKKVAARAVSEQLKQAQAELNRNGANLKVDGINGAQTRNAIMKFQADHKLKKTGRLDEATRAALHIA